MTTLHHSNFFVMRTPLLPLAEFLRWSGAGGAGEGDRARLREGLRGIVARPEVREALFVASPSLDEAIEAWLADPASPRGQKVEGALVRYFSRMTSRATPFGLFAGCSLGRMGQATRLELGSQTNHRKHTRLDMEFLLGLTEELSRDANLRAELKLRPNASIYRAAGQLRYTETRYDGRERLHHLVAVEVSDYLLETLERAEGGASANELALALASEEIELDEALAYIDDLVDSQVLTPELGPPVTGAEPIHALIERLQRLPAAASVASGLTQTRDALEALDAGGLGADPARYRQLAEKLARLPGKADLPRLFQVDLHKPAPQATLGADVFAEIARSVEILHRLSPVPAQDALARFRQAFTERYGERTMPLVEVLDEETGIGFERSSAPGAEGSPLIEGLRPTATTVHQIAWGARETHLLGKVLAATAAGATSIELSEDDLKKLETSELRPLPDSLAIMAVVAAKSTAALDAGDFQLLACGADGPSGARAFGRFCHGDAELHQAVADHLYAEEALRPDAVFAEVVHLPEGRVGNVLLRPVLRGYEIPYLGQSGADDERQIAPDDLTIAVEGETIRLFSKRLGKEVIPRLTSAHNFVYRGLGLYHFLGQLQSQNICSWLNWDWGPLESAPFLPRVTVGRIVLARARWLLAKSDLAALGKARGGEIFAAMRRLRESRNLPRYVVLSDRDNELLVDLDNALSVESLVETIKNRDEATLLEFLPGGDELAACGPEGGYCHELLVPLIRAKTTPATMEIVRPGIRLRDAESCGPLPPPSPQRGRGQKGVSVVRQFAPGSEWLYAKIYCGAASVDRLLADAVRPVIDESLADGSIDDWFFIRYGDPEWHLRLRLHGDPQALASLVLPRLHAALAGALTDSVAWKLQLDTYEREVERYAGAEGIALCERLFTADSEAALGLAEQYPGDGGYEARWRLALAGCDSLLDDLGLDLEAKSRVVGALRESFGREFASGDLKQLLSQKHRKLRGVIEPLLDRHAGSDPLMQAGFLLLARRSAAMAPAMHELMTLAAAGRLTISLEELASSLLHMWINRALRSAQRAHELVIYDFLDRSYRSKRARAVAPSPASLVT